MAAQLVTMSSSPPSSPPNLSSLPAAHYNFRRRKQSAEAIVGHLKIPNKVPHFQKRQSQRKKMIVLCGLKIMALHGGPPTWIYAKLVKEANTTFAAGQECQHDSYLSCMPTQALISTCESSEATVPLSYIGDQQVHQQEGGSLRDLLMTPPFVPLL